MNEFLKTRDQIDESTRWLQVSNYLNHPISCKDWELANVTQNLTDGHLLDMGADGSFVLHNAIKKGIIGRKVGIDLAEVTGGNKAEGAEYFVGDLMHTPFESESFDTVVSLSTIEHEVNLASFAKESSRLLKSGGKLIVSFDYWNPKVLTDGLTLYGLKWNILCKSDFIPLIENLNDLGLYAGSIDLTIREAVITPQYCSPFSVSYTFGIFEFIKK